MDRGRGGTARENNRMRLGQAETLKQGPLDGSMPGPDKFTHPGMDVDELRRTVDGARRELRKAHNENGTLRMIEIGQRKRIGQEIWVIAGCLVVDEVKDM